MGLDAGLRRHDGDPRRLFVVDVIPSPVFSKEVKKATKVWKIISLDFVLFVPSW